MGNCVNGLGKRDCLRLMWLRLTGELDIKNEEKEIQKDFFQS